MGAAQRTSSPTSLAAEAFRKVADRLAARADDVALFTESGGCYEAWWLWEALAACRAAGWASEPRPGYSDAGVAGSRDHADLSIFDPATGRRLLAELAIVHDWTTNKWIAGLNGDTERLRRAAAAGTTGLQLILAASLASPVEVNARWRGWLSMTAIWDEPTELEHSMPLGRAGQMLLRGWVVA